MNTKSMSISIINPPQLINYSINELQDEARHLVAVGSISRRQPIYVLCKYIPPREWICIESELERCEYLLRDSHCRFNWFRKMG